MASPTPGPDKIYQVAKPEIGYHEGSNNQNKYAATVGVPNNQAWCTTFVSWLFIQAGYRSLILVDDYSVNQYNWYKARNRSSGYPAVGAVVWFGPGAGTHTGWVYAYDADYIYTIEGNFNNEVSFQKRSRRSDIASIGAVYAYGYPNFTEGIITADPNATVAGSRYQATASVDTTGGTTPPPDTTPPATGGSTYTVVSGDTMSGIALKLGVTLDALVAANPQVTNINVIDVGQVLNVPSGGTTTPPTDPPPVERKSYTVKSGDTFAAIATAQGVSLADLLGWNSVAPVVGAKLWTGPEVSAPPTDPPPTGDAWIASVKINDKTAVEFTRYTSGGTVDEWIKAACSARGINSAAAQANWIKGYKTAIARESSGNANACNTNDSNNTTPAGYSKVADYGDGYGNPSGLLNGRLVNYQCSRGVAQCIPQTFAANHCPGTANKIYDPVANIAASMGYVRAVYGVAADGSNLASKVQQFDPNRSPKGY